MDRAWYEPWIWTDYRLAVLFTVFIPLGFLAWAALVRAEALQSLLIIYWKVASLLAITVYLMIGSLPLSFLASVGARIVIPIGLWFWADLNDEIDDQPQKRLGFLFKAWRWSMTIYCAIGTIAVSFSLPCAFKTSHELVATTACRAWLEPTWLYREYFHNTTNPSFLGVLGLLGLTIYLAYLGYFLSIRLPKQGRSALRG